MNNEFVKIAGCIKGDHSQTFKLDPQPMEYTHRNLPNEVLANLDTLITNNYRIVCRIMVFQIIIRMVYNSFR
jgi:hypothetical protein